MIHPFSRLRRIAAGLLALLMLTMLLGSCSSVVSKPIEPSEQDIKVVATCEGYDIYYEEFRYVALSFRDQFVSRYGKDIWTDAEKTAKYLPLLKEKITESLTVNYAILSLCDNYNIDYQDKKIQEAVQDMIDETVVEIGGRDNYIEMLAAMYMTDHFVRFTLATDMCETELVYVLKDLGLVIDNEKDFLPYALKDENFCATYHVFIGNDPGDDIEANRAKAQEVADKVLNGADIKQIIGSSVNEDVGSSGIPYHFTHNEYDKPYEEAAFALEIGECSGVVECENGFYIIQRQPLSESYIVNNVSTLWQRYQYAEVEALIDEQQSRLVVEWNDYGNELLEDLLNLK